MLLNTANLVMFGSVAVDKVYAGANLVWAKSTDVHGILSYVSLSAA